MKQLANQIMNKIDKFHKKLLSRKAVRYFEVTILLLSLVAFLLHIALISIQRNTDITFDFLNDGNDPSYLSALATPFNFILIFEVFILVASLPKNITTAVLRQYQIIGLVIVRNVFKDISHFDNISSFSNNSNGILEVVLDMVAGLIIFILIGAFLYLKRKFEKLDITKDLNIKFKTAKILVTLFAVGAFFGLLGLNLYGLSTEELLRLMFVDFTANNDFFTNLFTLLIILDAVILILSYLFNDEFEFVMRDAFFIISTILIRIALTSPKPYDVAFAIGGTLFGILGFIAFGIYNKAKYKDLVNVNFDQILNKPKNDS